MHESDVDVSVDAHKMIVLAAMPDDREQWTQRVIDWDKKYNGAKSGTLLVTQKVYEGRSRERTARSWRWLNPFRCRRPELRVEFGVHLQEVAGRCEGDAGRPRCRQEQIGCDTGQHVRPRRCDAGGTTNQGAQDNCESGCNENKCEGPA